MKTKNLKKCDWCYRDGNGEPVKKTLKHRVRQFIGLRGRMPFGEWVYCPFTKIVKAFGFETTKFICNLDYRASKILNLIIPYKKI
jgi:hypothetical protein